MDPSLEKNIVINYKTYNISFVTKIGGGVQAFGLDEISLHNFFQIVNKKLLFRGIFKS